MKNLIYVENNKVENHLGSKITYKDGILYLNGSGYFAIDASFTFYSENAGDVSIALLRNGKPIKEAVQTIPNSGAYGSVCIPTIIQTDNNCDDLSVRFTGLAEMITWSIMVVEV